MELGLAIGLFAAAIAAILPGMGSAKAVGLAGETAAGVSAETPEASSKLTLLQLLPATQGIYGFVIAIVIMAKIGIMGGSGAVVPVDKALMLLAAPSAPAPPADCAGWLLFRDCAGQVRRRFYADGRPPSGNAGQGHDDDRDGGNLRRSGAADFLPVRQRHRAVRGTS